MKYTQYPRQDQISIVIPAFNEELSLPILIQEIDEVLEKAKISAEIILVNDCSTDRTHEVMLQQLARVYGKYEVTVLSLDKNYGLSTALEAGFRAARNEIIVSIDADLQNDPADIPKLLSYIPQYDAVVGVRARRNDSFVKRMSSKIANGIRDRVLHEKWRDTGCTLKVYKKTFLAGIPLFKGMHRFLPTLLKMQGAEIVEVDVHHRPRTLGVSKYNFWNRLIGPLLDLLAVKWMKNRHAMYGVSVEQSTPVYGVSAEQSTSMHKAPAFQEAS